MQKIVQIFSKLRGSIFFKNTLSLFFGTAVSQIIPILAMPFLTRWYAPAEFGTYALFLSIVSIASVIASFRYELAIMLPKKDSEAVDVFCLGLLIVVFFSAGLMLFESFFNFRLQGLLKDPNIGLGLKLAPLMVLLIGIQQCSYYWLSRSKKYKTLAALQIIRSGVKVFLQLLLVVKLLVQGATGLIIGAIAGQACSSILIILATIRDETFSLGKCQVKGIFHQSKKFSKFPKINSPHALINTIAGNLPVLLLTKYYSSTVSGFYSLSLTIVMLPISFISSAVSQVFFQRVSKAFNSGENLNFLAKKMVKTLFLIAFFPFVLMLIFLPHIFFVVFGSKWVEAGVYTRLLLPWVFMVFVTSPLSYIPITLGKQKKAFEIEVVGILLKFGGLYCGYCFNSPKGSIALFSFAGVIILFYSLFWILDITKQERN